MSSRSITSITGVDNLIRTVVGAGWEIIYQQDTDPTHMSKDYKIHYHTAHDCCLDESSYLLFNYQLLINKQ